MRKFNQWYLKKWQTSPDEWFWAYLPLVMLALAVASVLV